MFFFFGGAPGWISGMALCMFFFLVLSFTAKIPLNSLGLAPPKFAPISLAVPHFPLHGGISLPVATYVHDNYFIFKILFLEEFFFIKKINLLISNLFIKAYLLGFHHRLELLLHHMWWNFHHLMWVHRLLHDIKCRIDRTMQHTCINISWIRL